MNYPYIRTCWGKVLVLVVLDEEGNETLDWYSAKEIKQILKEQKEEK